MLISYSRDNSIGEAIDMTFDFEHPCSMCKSIQKAQVASAAQSHPEGLQGSTSRYICGLLAIAHSFIPPAFTHQHYEPGHCLIPPSPIFPPPSPPPIRA